MSLTPLVENKKKQKKQYFTQETEDAIIRYNGSSDFDERSRIYEREIHYAFFKLTQNIIHTFKFYYTDVEDIEDLQHELMEFLLTKIHLFHHSRNINDRLNKIINKTFKEENQYNHHDYRIHLDKLVEGSFVEFMNDSPKVTQQDINNFINTLQVSKECLEKLKTLTPPKAFSYFGTITKRWLIIENDKNYKKKKKVDRVDMNELDENISTGEIISTNDNLYNFMEAFTKYCYDNLYEIYPEDKLFPENKLKVQIADAILNLFSKRDHLDIFNKKALYFNIRELVDAKTQKITEVANELKSIFTPAYVNYLETGIINFEPYIFILKNERSR